nr:glycosyltransferase [uncultured Halomonas sp.]
MTVIQRVVRRLVLQGSRDHLQGERRLLAQSGLFDANWYLAQPGVAESPAARRDPARHYLMHGAAAGLSPGPTFDGVWYLEAYPDVTAAGLNPLVHYLRHGQAEGRLPRRNRALAWEYHLWRGLSAMMVPRLRASMCDGEAPREERQYAGWALARWWALQEDWSAVAKCLLPHDALLTWPDHPGPGLLALEALFQLGDQTRARSVLATLSRRFPDCSDIDLAQANWLAQSDAIQTRLAWINRPLQAQGLLPIALHNERQPLSLDNLACTGVVDHHRSSAFGEKTADTPCVSVILPVYNAASTIGTALRSLFAQTWPNLEILVVDDASTDDSVRVLEQLAQDCPATIGYRLLRHSENQGAYAARNTGLAAASGALITTHDSDDWSHAQKIERQVAALQAAPKASACLSHWVRVRPGLVFHRWRMEEGWVYRNISSLMLHRSVVERLGYWDEVSVNADTEYHERLLAVFGHAAVIEVLPGVPLAFGRSDAGSLSQRSDTHLATQFHGVRRDYMASARRWHRAATTPDALYLPRNPNWRPFAAPVQLCRHALPVRYRESRDWLQATALFDASWYLRTHIDLQTGLIDPLTHYWAVGSAEERDPGPHFSVSGYRRQYPEVAEQGIDPLLHYLVQGRQEGRDPWPIFSGHQSRRMGRPSILLCGHRASKTLHGAERSLLDVLKALNALEFNVVVTLPSASNASYLQALLTESMAVAVLPYGWWQAGKAPEAATLRHFTSLIQRFGIDAVHANTLMLDEPLQAARQAGIPVLVHVRELPAHDPSLCSTLGADADTIGRRVLALADTVIANSQCVIDYFATLGLYTRKHAQTASAPQIHRVANTLDMVPLLALPPPGTKGAFTVGMLSCNQPKKGLADLEIMAAHLSSLAPKVRVAIFGPRTPALEALLARQAQGLAPSNLEYRGYVAYSTQALNVVDVLVNLSRFQESFGRTVLEAMVASRPVVCYAWGALPELVVDEVTGHLVPFAEPEAAARRVAELACDHPRVVAMGRAGRERAGEHFSQARMTRRLKSVYSGIIPVDRAPG